MSIVAECPSCQRKLRVPGNLLGKKVRCPTCLSTFTANADIGLSPAEPLVSEEEVPPPRRPPLPSEERYEVEPPAKSRSPAQLNYDEEEEPAEEFEEKRPRRRRRAPEADDWEEDWERQRRSDLSNDYSVDVGEWLDYAKSHYSSVLGAMIGYTLLSFVISTALGFIPIVGLLVNLLINPSLQAGFTIVCLAQLKGKSWSFGDFFGGFQFFGSLLANVILVCLLSGLIMMPSGIVLIIAAVSREPSLFIVAGGFALLNGLALLYLMLRAACFNIPLIIDRGYGPIEAFQGSWTLSRGHFWGLLGAFLLVGIIGGSGFLLCGIGALFTLPLYHLATTAGYLLIAGTRKPRRTPR
jgi:hypothetical protein